MLSVSKRRGARKIIAKHRGTKRKFRIDRENNETLWPKKKNKKIKSNEESSLPNKRKKAKSKVPLPEDSPLHNKNDDNESNEIVIEDSPLSPTPSVDSIPEIFKIDKIELNPIFSSNLSYLKKLYSDPTAPNKLEIENDFYIIRKPFKVVQLRNFIKNDSTIECILQAISLLTLNKLNNDLYSMEQSRELQKYCVFENLVSCFQNDIKKLLSDLTSLELNDNVSLTVSKYKKYDYLLCHDDQLDKRKIAFILYLVDEEWSVNDGGQLELFSVTDDSQPFKVVERLVPKFNSLIFFEVNSTSFHQVSEVLTSRSPRLSINGWFYSDTIEKVNPKLSYPRILTFPSQEIIYDDLNSHLKNWINPAYLDSSIQKQIRENFRDKSEIQLSEFIQFQKRCEIEEALKSKKMNDLWKEYFKPLYFRYEYIDPDDFEKLPNILKEFYLLIHSNSFYRLILKLTGCLFRASFAKTLREVKRTQVELMKNKKFSDENFVESLKTFLPSSEKETKSDYTTRGMIYRWNPGFYTLSNDINPEIIEKAIDIDFFFNVPIKSHIKFGEQEIIEISDSDDDDHENDKNNNKNNNNKNKNKNNNNNNENKQNNNNDTNKVTVKLKPAEPCTSSSLPPNQSEIIELDEDSNNKNEDEKSTADKINSEICLKESVGKSDEEPHRGGGYLVYIDDNSNQQILEIDPNSSFLNIIYRKYHCQRFMKYIDLGNKNVPFHQISVVFAES